MNFGVSCHTCKVQETQAMMLQTEGHMATERTTNIEEPTSAVADSKRFEPFLASDPELTQYC